MTDPVSSPTGDPVEQSNGQPQYGQYQEPEYGARASQYPSGYDPYVYGRPEPEGRPKNAEPEGARNAAWGVGAGSMPNDPRTGYSQPGDRPPYQGNQPGNMPNQGWYGQQWQGAPTDASGQEPRYRNGINVDDPAQNPLYGHWDPYAVISLICSLFFVIPVLPAVMGALAMWRTKAYHMKGFWLGFAAVALNVFETIMMVWMLMHGVTFNDYYSQMLGMLGGGTGGSGGSGGSGGDGSISA